MKKLITLLAVTVFTIVAPALSSAQNDVTHAKALLTVNFVRYVGWPQDEYKGSSFSIGILEGKDIALELKKIAEGKSFGMGSVEIQEFASIDDVKHCHMIYVSRRAAAKYSLDTIKSKVGKGTLIVSETDGMTQAGSMINFVVRNKQLKFELSKSNASASGLSLSSRLEGMTSAISL